MTNRRAVARMLVAGVVLIFGGEAFCFLGPDERVVHISCHAALYAGIFLACLGALLEGIRRLRAMRQPSDEAARARGGYLKVSRDELRSEQALAELRTLTSSPAPRTEKARAMSHAIKVARGYRWVGLYDVTPDEIVAIAWTGSEPPAYPRFPVSKGLSGAAVASRQPVVVQDVTTDPRYLTAFSSTRSEAIYPVVIDGRVVGTIDVESDRVNAFGPVDEGFMKTCLSSLSVLWL